MIYLTSKSPRRQQILKQLGIAHTPLLLPEQEDDEPRLTNESPHDYVRRTAREKAYRAIDFLLCNQQAENRQKIAILSADTCVSLGQEILGKPESPNHAAQILKRLSKRIHHVETAVSVAIANDPKNIKGEESYKGYQLFHTASLSTVTLKALSDEEINTYCASNEPMGKAGAYGIQGRAAAFVTHLSGSYTGVMGLPAYETMELLKRAGVV